MLALGCMAGLAAASFAQAAESIVVGRSLVLSGPLRSYGEAKRDGGDAYIRKVNAAGGIGGKPIELITLDDEYAPPKTVANLRKMAAEHSPVAFLGLFGVPTVAAALPVLQELKIPAVGLTSGAAAVREPFNRYSFPVRASYADESARLVNHIKATGATRISVIFSDNPFGITVRDTLMVAMKKAGLTAKLVKVDPPGKEAAEAARQATADAPQAIFLTMLSQAALPVLTEVRKINAYSALYTFSPVDTTTITKQMGDKAHGLAITQVVPIPSSQRERIVLEYNRALTELGRGSPSFYGLEAFIEAKVLVEGLKRSGGGISPASLVKALETMQDKDLGDFYVTYTPTAHTGSRFVDIDMIDIEGRLIR